MTTVALVPLRGGSKGIKDKNIKPLFGKPLCYWVLEAASCAAEVDEVYVSTDSQKIANVVESLGLGVQVIERPDSLATDSATTEAVVEHFLSVLSPKVLITIQATSPLLQSSDIDAAMSQFRKNDLDSLISINRLKQFLWNENGTPLNYDPRNRPRRQDFAGAIVENGAFYISKRTTILKHGSRIGGKVGFFELSEAGRLEIDDMVDFRIADLLLRYRSAGNRQL
jgi:CMP-N-acetylneuraminic acid synthetase